MQSGAFAFARTAACSQPQERWPVGSGVMRRPLVPPHDRPNPTGPRRCGGPEHSAGLSIGYTTTQLPSPGVATDRGVLLRAGKIAQPARKSIIYPVDCGENCVNVKTAGLTVASCSIRDDAVAAVSLGPVESLVRALDHRGGVVVFAQRRNPDGNGDVDCTR